MIICLSKQIRALEYIKDSLGETLSETYKFSDFNKYMNNRESANTEFEESYIPSLYNDNYNFTKEFDYAEEVINHLKRNKKKYKLAVMLLATTVNFGVFGTSTSLALSSASLGYKLYDKGVEICKIICILGFMVEGGKCLLTGTIESLWRVAIRYGTFMLSIRYLPDIVDWFFIK